jgi:1,2-phenylacetyl-CoA epoxidase PaaB subunit
MLMTYQVEVWGQTPGGAEFVKRRRLQAVDEDGALDLAMEEFKKRYPGYKICGGDVVRTKGRGLAGTREWVTCR